MRDPDSQRRCFAVDQTMDRVIRFPTSLTPASPSGVWPAARERTAGQTYCLACRAPISAQFPGAVPGVAEVQYFIRVVNVYSSNMASAPIT